MNGLLRKLGKRVLSPWERAALQSFRTERAIAAHHRAGLHQVRRRSLSRPSRLNLGCGRHPKQGFLNVDMLPGGDLTLDIRRGLPFDSNCCDLIFSEHCLEHIDYPEPITSVFRECLRVLRPGGVLRFSVPDTEWPLLDYREGAEATYFRACDQHGWHPRTCTTRMEHINYHFRQHGEHLFAYDFETADKLLQGIGFVDVQRSSFDAAIDSKHRELGSLFVTARKPS